MEILCNLRIRASALIVLVLQNCRGRTRITSEEKKQIVLQIKQSLFGNDHRRRHNRAVLLELETSDTAVGRNKLILFADRLLQNIDLDAASLLGQLMRVDDILLVGVEGFE